MVSAGRARPAVAPYLKLRSSPRRMEHLSGAGGVVMVGLGLRLALTGRHD